MLGRARHAKRPVSFGWAPPAQAVAA
jgi:hypothetical protein